MGCCTSKETPRVPAPRTPLKPGRARICVAGFVLCPPAVRASKIADHIARTYPGDSESWFFYTKGDAFYNFTKATFDSVPFPEHLKGHASSPFCWIETADPANPGKNVITPIGGNDHLQQWAKAKYPADKKLQELCKPPSMCTEEWNNERTSAPRPTAQ
jgi:hypothetical protein